MSNLSQFFGASGRASGQDPHRQPAFMQFFGGHSNLHPSVLHYDHALRVINRQTTSGSGTTANRFDDWQTDGLHTQGGVGINQPNNSAYQVHQAMGMQTGTNTFLGSTCYPASILSDAAPTTHSSTVRSYSGSAIRLNGTSIGLDQNYALFTHRHDATNQVGTEAGFHITLRDPSEAFLIYNGTGGPGKGAIATRNYVKVQAAGVLTTGYRMAVGGVSYNQRTKKLVIMERVNGDNASWRPVLIHNAPNPNEYINNNAGYQTALTAAAAVSGARVVGGATFSGGTYSSYNENHLWVRPILSDDNSIVYFNIQNNDNKVGVIKYPWSGALIGGSFGTPVIVGERTSSTVYSAGYNATARNCGSGSQWQMSLDGKTVLLSAQSHYYGAGLQYMMINTLTGGVSKIIVKHDTSHAQWVIPVGASGFVILGSDNTDGGGQYVSRLNWLDYDIYGGGAGTYAGAMDHPANWTQRLLDAAFYTTMYPSIHQHIGIDNKAIALAEQGKWQV